MLTTRWTLFIATMAILAALQLWMRPLLPVDETRYLAVAWEMWQRGDFLVPYLNGEPYSHKPPMLFWLIHGVWTLFGVSELAARLIFPLIGLLVIWLTVALAKKLWPGKIASENEVSRTTGLQSLVPWLLFGGLFWMNFYTLVQFDLLLSLAALIAWHGILDVEERPLRGWLITGCAMGAGIIIKGPVILVPVLPALLLAPWWQASRYSYLKWYSGAFMATLAGAAIALAWAIPAGLAGGAEYREAIFWGQSAGRVLNSFAHRNPWWSYLLWLPLMWLPWLLWPALFRAVQRAWKTGLDPGMRFCLAVVLPALLVFSLVSGKQGKYLLPLFPLIALLLARILANLNVPAHGFSLRFAGSLMAAIGITLLVLSWRHNELDWPGTLSPVWGAGLLVAGAIVFRIRIKPLVTAVQAAALGMIFSSVIIYLAIVPAARAGFDLQDISTKLSQLQKQGAPIAWLGKYHGQFHFPGRLLQRIEPVDNSEAVSDWLKKNSGGYLLVNYKTLPISLPENLFQQRYRGGWVVLWPAGRLTEQPGWLDDLRRNA